jgi:hypothetical protein
MICDSGCLARCGGGYRKITGRFGISRPLNSYIHDIYDILALCFPYHPPDSDPSAGAEVLVEFFRTSAPTEPCIEGPGTYSGRSIVVAINVLLHFFPATETAPSPSRAYQTRCIRLAKDMPARQFFIFSQGVGFMLCNMRGPGQSFMPAEPVREDRVNSV